MPTYIRWKDEGATYFFTVVTHERRAWFAHADNRRLLARAFRGSRRQMPFEIDAFVCLPDHFHVLLRPGDGVDYSALWRLIKTTFTRELIASIPADDPALGGRRRHERSVWQRRFYEHLIRNERDWRRHVDYIHLNPVKHGWVDDPREWRWSSIHRFISSGMIDPQWPGTSAVELPEVGE